MYTLNIYEDRNVSCEIIKTAPALAENVVIMEDPIVHSKKLTRKGFQDLYSNCETGEVKVNPYFIVS